ncbi:flavin monoamine oxidase [Paractinoplanes deccanensis]|uniref:Flavin monoamine oxidase n=1 Tax=Paractinoplanes deccanensis TaxID=113561 RepID=A0ABQ3Y433_9ACTN|nr:FAD-dependent oxidoreductase [Actinoplanes deccanensis]GID74754.1 flavin monoamine oxidase [Actinoplanes deccanensis]
MDGLTRRRFLQALGVSGGAGALLATLAANGGTAVTPPWTPPARAGRAGRSVVVLGGGIAGLTTAYELGKAGHRCTVLEARARPGGRVLTIRGGDRETDLDGHTQRAAFAYGTYFNAGAARIAPWMVTLDYCRELGVPVEVFVNSNADAFIHRSAGGAPVRFRTARADLYGYVSQLLTRVTRQGLLDAELATGGRDELLAFLREFGRLTDTGEYLGGPDRGFAVYPGADGGVPLQGPPSLSEVLTGGAGASLGFDLGFDQAMPMFQPVGGMDRIPAALARAVGEERIRLGAEVVAVTNRPDGVEVRYRQDGRAHAIVADFCVATLPPHLMARIPHNLGDDVSLALAAFRPAAAGKIGLEYASRWWETELGIYGGSTDTDLDLRQVWYPSSGFHSPRGLVVGYYNFGPDAEAYASLAPRDRAARAVSLGERIHGPRFRTELASSFSVSWSRVPHLEGAWATPPYGSPAFALLRSPAGRVLFAGDWLSHTVAWQHGAFVSARAAVTAVHERA